MKVKFKFLTGDLNWLQYGAKWVSQKLNNGDFDYFLVIDFRNMDEDMGRHNRGHPKYWAGLSAVSPQQAGEKNIQAAFDCRGITKVKMFDVSELNQVDCLHDYSGFVGLWNGKCNNARALLRQARREAQVCEGLFGFYMDRPVNQIGTTGWEAIKGDLNSATAPHHRQRERHGKHYGQNARDQTRHRGGSQVKKPALQSLDSFTRAYITAMAWTEQPEAKARPGEFSLDDHYYSRMDGLLIARCVQDCAEFMAEHGALVEEGGTKIDHPYERAGHDFWLTRNRHGSGFWDGDWPEPWAAQLTKAAHAFGQAEPCWYKGRLYL
jgi:hypothetical protein